MLRVCGKCNQEIAKGEQVMVCEGFCENLNRFHLNCAGLTVEFADMCQHRNIMWMCDCCRDKMEDHNFRDAVNKMKCDAEPQKMQEDSELDVLKQEISRINSSLVELSEFVKNGNGSAITANSTRNMQNVLSSTPIHSETEDSTDFELYLSNIAPDVTEEDVKALVTNVLDPPEPFHIKRLVPAWKNVATLDFVSFRVKLQRRHKTNALDASLWPTGIRCREFRSHFSCTWRPNR